MKVKEKNWTNQVIFFFFFLRIYIVFVISAFDEDEESKKKKRKTPLVPKDKSTVAKKPSKSKSDQATLPLKPLFERLSDKTHSAKVCSNKSLSQLLVSCNNFFFLSLLRQRPQATLLLSI